MNVWVIINTWTKEIIQEVTHLQLAESIENELAANYKANFVGPRWHTFHYPFTICRIDCLSRFYPCVKQNVALLIEGFLLSEIYFK